MKVGHRRLLSLVEIWVVLFLKFISMNKSMCFKSLSNEIVVATARGTNTNATVVSANLVVDERQINVLFLDVKEVHSRSTPSSSSTPNQSKTSTSTTENTTKEVQKSIIGARATDSARLMKFTKELYGPAPAVILGSCLRFSSPQGCT